MENFEKLKPGQSLTEADAFLGKSSPVRVTEVQDEWADGAQASAEIMGIGPGVRVDRNSTAESIQSMVRTYTILSWVRWQNRTANIFAGIRKGDDGSSLLGVIGYLDYDVAAKNYSAQWKVTPISVEMSNFGVRTSIGKPLTPGSPTNYDQVRLGMAEREIHELLGMPRSIESLTIEVNPAVPVAERRPRKMWRYYDDHSHCLPPPAFGAAMVGLAASLERMNQIAILVSLPARVATYDIIFEDDKVVEKRSTLGP